MKIGSGQNPTSARGQAETKPAVSADPPRPVTPRPPARLWSLLLPPSTWTRDR